MEPGRYLPVALQFANAVLAGAALMLITWRASDRNGRGSPPGAEPISTFASVLFVCVGMTAVMILVNDNLARAFAVGAAVALVRFRVKMQGKLNGISLFYGVITGMACGVSRPEIAWTLVFLFGALSLVMALARNQLNK